MNRRGPARGEVGVCLLDADGLVVDIDEAFCRLTSVGCPSAVVGRSLLELLPAAPPSAGEQPTRARIHDDGDEIELCRRRARAGAVAEVVSARRIHSESVLARQLRVARQTLDSIIEASPLAITTLDHDKRVVMWNLAAERIFGWTREEILGRPYPLVPEDQRAGFEALFEKVVLRGEGFTGVDSVRRRKDGSAIEVRMHTAPLRDAEGRVTGGMALLEDLTDTRALEQRVRHSQKMEAVGHLAGGIAHDFNNLLTVIIGTADLLALDDSLDVEARERVAELLSVANSAQELVAQLMIFSRRQVVRPQVVDLGRHLGSAAKMLRRLLDARVELKLELGDQRIWVNLDPSQFDQVLINLAVNAADAMPEGGRLSYVVGCGQLDGSRPGPLGDGACAVLEVRDTGTGISAEVLPHIFDPFFTTKEVGAGTGLGLANVYAIVRQAGGDVEVDTEIDRGTCFRIHLPLAPVPAEQPVEPPRPTLPRGTERILLVEDNDSVRMSTARLLGALGYQVTPACDGAEALELLWEGLSVDLVLTDLAMPRLGGAELAHQLGTRHPELPVMFMSGNLDVDELRAQVEQGRVRFLQKPVTLRELARATRELLDP